MKRILVVEDHDDNLALMRAALEDDYEVLVARDGREALEVAGRERPDLILMDLSLPGMDGWEATHRLKADERLRGIPVIAVTAHAMRGDRERALEVGCDDYLAKPIALRSLYRMIESHLGGERTGGAQASGGPAD